MPEGFEAAGPGGSGGSSSSDSGSSTSEEEERKKESTGGSGASEGGRGPSGHGFETADPGTGAAPGGGASPGDSISGGANEDTTQTDNSGSEGQSGGGDTQSFVGEDRHQGVEVHAGVGPDDAQDRTAAALEERALAQSDSLTDPSQVAVFREGDTLQTTLTPAGERAVRNTATGNLAGDLNARFPTVNVGSEDISVSETDNGFSATISDDVRQEIREDRAEATDRFLDESRTTSGETAGEAIRTETRVGIRQDRQQTADRFLNTSRTASGETGAEAIRSVVRDEADITAPQGPSDSVESIREAVEQRSAGRVPEPETVPQSEVSGFVSSFEQQTGVDVPGEGRATEQVGGPGAAEDFGEIDFSFGLGGPEDEVERTIETTDTGIRDAVNDPRVERTFERGMKFSTPTNLFIRQQTGVGAEVGGDVSGLQGTAAGALTLPTQVGTLATEGTEFAVEGAERTASGEGGEFVDDATQAGINRAVAGGEFAFRNPRQFAGNLAGSSIAASGAIGATSKFVSPRAGQALGNAFDPGRTAVKAARKGAGRAKGEARRFAASERGQADLTFGGESSVETETESGPVDVDMDALDESLGQMEARGRRSSMRETRGSNPRNRFQNTEISQFGKARMQRAAGETQRDLDLGPTADVDVADPDASVRNLGSPRVEADTDLDASLGLSPSLGVGGGVAGVQSAEAGERTMFDSESLFGTAQEPQARLDETSLDAGGQPDFSMGLDMDLGSDASQLTETAQQSELDTAPGPAVETDGDLGADSVSDSLADTDSLSGIASDLDVGVASDARIDNAVETRTEARTETRTEPEARTEPRVELAENPEFNPELEAESAINPEVEAEVGSDLFDETDDDDRRRRGFAETQFERAVGDIDDLLL